ncbi:MAG: primosomal protein N' [Firmicutes bacterium]|nr:primosomal protein N' [Bacillota bacterium]
MQFVNVIVENNTNATDELYTYSYDPMVVAGEQEGGAVPEEAFPGLRVFVPFGRYNRRTEAFVAQTLGEPPEGIPAGRIKGVISADLERSLSSEAMETALWMHRRYLCRYIEAVRCFTSGEGEHKRKTKDPFADIEIQRDADKPLTEPQTRALAEITHELEAGRSRVFLLHGVTGSGKTEVYLQAAGKALSQGRGAIILVPEISLTPQTVSRFMNRFGREAVAVLHSRLTPAQRDAEYARVKRGEAKLVIGARSAVFAPFGDIGLIVLDEEHESSYKSDKSPKYDAIELAIMRAQKHSAVVVLGSATPSVADYYRSEQGIFRRIELRDRYNLTPLPEVELVDMTAEIRAGNRSVFSRRLASAIEDCLEKKKQVILFLNRRGYYSFVSCRECGHTVRCPECGIAMPYHKDEGCCVCHYCGRKQRLPKTCPECGSSLIGMYGVGTQQVEEKARELFPKASIERIDLDSVKKKGSLESILKRFGKGKTDILIGTQLVAKGLDFDNVGLVGVISADSSLNIPDFRSSERCFQLLTQAAGRSGRGDERGLVVIQGYDISHPSVRAAARHDYEGFYESEIAVRRMVSYPPFSYIFQLVFSDEDEARAFASAQRYAAWLRENAAEGTGVLGPAASSRQKLAGQYRFQILVKAPADRRRETSELVARLKKEYSAAEGEAALLTTDINPFSFA